MPWACGKGPGPGKWEKKELLELWLSLGCLLQPAPLPAGRVGSKMDPSLIWLLPGSNLLLSGAEAGRLPQRLQLDLNVLLGKCSSGGRQRVVLRDPGAIRLSDTDLQGMLVEQRQYDFNLLGCRRWNCLSAPNAY